MTNDESPWTEFWRWMLGALQMTAMVLAAACCLMMWYESKISIPPRMCLDNSPMVDRQ